MKRCQICRKQYAADSFEDAVLGQIPDWPSLCGSWVCHARWQVSTLRRHLRSVEQ